MLMNIATESIQPEQLKGDVLHQPAHSTDLAPSNYHLLTKQSDHLSGTHFSDGNEVKDVMKTWLQEVVGEVYHIGI